MVSRWLREVGLIGGLSLLNASDARATNGLQAPVPPVFVDGAHVRTVDPQQPGVLAYALPREDLQISADEPADSRTLQFFSVCRELELNEQLPVWISWADYDAARAANPTLAEASDEDVLETAALGAELDSETGEPCVVALTDVDQRRRLACEAAADDVALDALAGRPGRSVLWGYTYEPPVSMWTRAPGVVRAGESGPVATFTEPLGDMTLSLQAGVVVQLETSPDVVWVQWSWARAAEPNTWTVAGEIKQQARSRAEFAFVPPDDTEYQALYFRAEVRDAQGRSWTTTRKSPAVVFPGCEPPQAAVTPSQNVCGREIERDVPALVPAQACDRAVDDASDDTPEFPSSSSEPRPDQGRPDRGEQNALGSSREPSTSGCGLGGMPPSSFGPFTLLIVAVTQGGGRRSLRFTRVAEAADCMSARSRAQQYGRKAPPPPLGGR